MLKLRLTNKEALVLLCFSVYYVNFSVLICSLLLMVNVSCDLVSLKQHWILLLQDTYDALLHIYFYFPLTV